MPDSPSSAARPGAADPRPDGRANRWKHIKPVIARGVDKVVGTHVAELREAAPVTRVNVAKHRKLTPEGALVDLRHFGIVGQGYGGGDFVLFEDLLERVASEEVQFVPGPRGRLRQLQEVNVSTGNTGSEHAVGDEMKPGRHWGFLICDLRFAICDNQPSQIKNHDLSRCFTWR